MKVSPWSGKWTELRLGLIWSKRVATTSSAWSSRATISKHRRTAPLRRCVHGEGVPTMASIKKRPDVVWRARYRDEADKEHSRHFIRRVDAQRWIDETTASIVMGNCVDPRNAGTLVKTCAARWEESAGRARDARRDPGPSCRPTHARRRVDPLGLLDTVGCPTQDRQMKVATAQRRADALDEQAEAARATAHRIQEESLATKTVAVGALRRLGASQLASRAGDEAASRTRLIVTLGEAEEAFDNRKGK
jgi:hypothetical protein